MRLFTSFNYQDSYLIPSRESGIHFCYILQPVLTKLLITMLDYNIVMSGSILKFAAKQNTGTTKFDEVNARFNIDNRELQIFRSFLTQENFACYRSRLIRIMEGVGVSKAIIKNKSSYELIPFVSDTMLINSNYDLVHPFTFSYKDFASSNYLSVNTLGSESNEKLYLYCEYLREKKSIPDYSILSHIWSVDKSSTISAFYRRLPAFYLSSFARVVWALGYGVLDPSKLNYKYYTYPKCKQIADTSGNGVCLVPNPTAANYCQNPIPRSNLPVANIRSEMKSSSSYVLLVR